MSKFVEYFVTDILEPHQGNAIYTKKNEASCISVGKSTSL